METATRRQFLKVGGVALGTVVLSGATGLVSCSIQQSVVDTPKAPDTPKAAETPKFPWAYVKLDPLAVAERAYTAYYNGGCMYGAFEGIIGELRERVGAPYTDFPAAMMKYGAAGVVGWGTLCGALNGPAAVIYLVQDPKTAKPIIDELFGWYGAEELPNYKPKTPKFDKIVTSVSASPLCHVSVTRWSEKSGLKTGSPERAERCAWLTASTAKYAVELLNKQVDGQFARIHAVPAEVKNCLSCHAKGGVVENVHITDQSSCTVCHEDVLTKHPIPLK